MDEPFRQSFGRIVVEPARRRLVIDGEPAKIGARAFDLLMALIDRRDRIVSKDQLGHRLAERHGRRRQSASPDRHIAQAPRR